MDIPHICFGGSDWSEAVYVTLGATPYGRVLFLVLQTETSQSSYGHIWAKRNLNLVAI